VLQNIGVEGAGKWEAEKRGVLWITVRSFPHGKSRILVGGEESLKACECAHRGKIPQATRIKKRGKGETGLPAIWIPPGVNWGRLFHVEGKDTSDGSPELSQAWSGNE